MVDAAHDHEPIVAGVGGRRVVAVVCTHGHNDHINAALALADATGAPVWLHPADTMLWDAVHPDRRPDAELADGQRIEVGGRTLEVLHTPGPQPGRLLPARRRRRRPLLGRHPVQGRARAPPAGRSPTSARSSRASAPASSRCRPTPSCTPATATTPAWATRPRTSTSGSPGATDRHRPARHAAGRRRRRVGGGHRHQLAHGEGRGAGRAARAAAARRGRGGDRLAHRRRPPGPDRGRLGHRRRARPPSRPTEPSLTVADLDAALDEVAVTTGPGSVGRRNEILGGLLVRATAAEADFVRRLLVGELRQGALEGVMVDAIARASEVPAAVVRRAHMLGGRLGPDRPAGAVRGPRRRSRRWASRWAGACGRCWPPPPPSVEEALAELGTCSVEWKLDGARIQVHRRGDEVVGLHPQPQRRDRPPARRGGGGPGAPGPLGRARRRDADDGRGGPAPVLPGLDVALRCRRGPARRARTAVLHPWFFDCLHVDGEDLLDRAAARAAGPARGHRAAVAHPGRDHRRPRGRRRGAAGRARRRATRA